MKTEALDLTGTYWYETGDMQIAADELAKLIPPYGRVANPDDNPNLELYRRASNAYYDLYNNGLCNMADEFAEVFGFAVYYDDLSNATVRRIERRITEFIKAAAAEQGIPS